jgi:hypothetical protein
MKGVKFILWKIQTKIATIVLSVATQFLVFKK